jgi:hypothetical protein
MAGIHQASQCYGAIRLSQVEARDRLPNAARPRASREPSDGRAPTRDGRVLAWRLFAISSVVIVAAALIYYLTRPPDQAQIDTAVLPVARTATTMRTFTDCSNVNSVTYDIHQPCQAFVLLRGTEPGSAPQLYRAEQGALRAAGWHRSAHPLRFDNDTGNDYAPLSAGWAAPGHQACAMLLNVKAGVAAERVAIFPYNPYDIPPGLYRFYRFAQSADRARTLWVQLIPGFDQNGHAAC